MKSTLLAAIASEQERRNAPAVRAMQRFSETGSTPPERHPSFARRLRNHAGEIYRAARLALALKRYNGKQIALPGNGHKLKEVRSELIRSGVPASEIGSLQVGAHPIWFSIDFLRLSYWLTLAVILRVSLTIRLSAGVKPYSNLIFNYAFIRIAFRQMESNPYWCVIGDLSPFLIALAGAARAENQKLMSWQYGYQDFKRFPAKPEIAVIHNRTGLRLARCKTPESRCFVYRRESLTPVRVHFSSSTSSCVGVALNAFSRADIFEQLKKLQHHLACSILVRPHPRDTAFRNTEQHSMIQMSHCQSLTDFCAAVDWVICGNTTTSLKIRALGVPVCQYFGFDLFFSDHFGYCEMHIMPGFEKIDQIDRTTVEKFYTNATTEPQLDVLFGKDIERHFPTLSRLSQDFSFREKSAQ